jgi:hypothetical protein
MFQLCFKFVSQICDKIGQHMADIITDVTAVGTVHCKKIFSRSKPHAQRGRPVASM